MKTKVVWSLVLVSMFGFCQTAFSENLKIDFKQIHGTRPQSELSISDAGLTPVALRQLDKIFAEGGMLETATFKQESASNLSSALYSITINSQGKIHQAVIDETSAPPAYTKLIKFILKHGVKATPVAQDTETTTAERTAAEKTTAEKTTAEKTATPAESSTSDKSTSADKKEVSAK